MKLEGYHNTESCNVDSIMKNGFTYKENPKHWLGQGIYFFADLDTAMLNTNMLNNSKEIKTIAVEIEIDETQYLDLDRTDNLNNFIKYWNNKATEFEQKGVELKIENTNQKKAYLMYQCLFLDLYKEERNYKVITKTFPKNNVPYAEKVKGFNYIGLPFLETYICVSEDEYIVKKNVIEPTIKKEYIIEDNITEQEWFI